MVDVAKNPHAILVPYPLQGHLIPSVHLAIKLASRGFTITFINTKSIHHHITTIHKDAGQDIFAAARKTGLDIRYTTISDGLPIKFNRSLNHDKFMASLLHVFYAHVEEAIQEIIRVSETAVTCLIADTFFVWPGKMAKKYGLLYISFWVEPALIFTLYYHLHLLRLNWHFGCIDLREDPINYIPGVDSLQPKDLTSYLQETNTTTVGRQILFDAFDDARAADYVLCNTVQDLEPKTISALQEKINFFAVGPIFSPSLTKSIVPTSLWAESHCTSWLDCKPAGSVLFISFGSHADITRNELKEIANGLQQSEVNFIWVLRPELVAPNDESKPLIEETSSRAMIVPWCCQIQVLAHRAIGGFLTHCGWNSVLEGIWCEVPLLCFPLNTDQFTNRKLVVNDWKIGINLCDRKPVTGVEVSKKIKQLMTGKSADELSHAIKEVKKILEKAVSTDGSSEKNMDQFTQELKDKIQKKGRSNVADH